jgi:hypothetical protein
LQILDNELLDARANFFLANIPQTMRRRKPAIVRAGFVRTGFAFDLFRSRMQRRKPFRRFGEPKLKIKEMGSRYFFICPYLWLEKYFSCGDYKKR